MLWGIQCNRLLGASKTNLYIESDDGIYICNIDSNICKKVADGIFIGASDEKILIYNSTEKRYQVVTID